MNLHSSANETLKVSIPSEEIEIMVACLGREIIRVDYLLAPPEPVEVFTAGAIHFLSNEIRLNLASGSSSDFVHLSWKNLLKNMEEKLQLR